MAETSQDEWASTLELRNRIYSAQGGRWALLRNAGTASLRIRALLLPALGLIASPLCAERLPTWSPHEMCAEADAIVMGDRVGVNKVMVRRWLRAPSALKDRGSLIDIPGLENHRRAIVETETKSKGSTTRHLKSQRLLCFLIKKQARWQVMGQGETGSPGMMWIESGRCFGYEQIEEHVGPGRPAYSLVASGFCRTEKQLLAEIRQGLEDHRTWKSALAIENPEEQAIVLCSYLLQRTSPEGEHETYRRRVRALLPKLGPHALAELRMLLRDARAGDRLDEAVLVLKDLGPLARPAAWDIVRLLQEPGLVDRATAIGALGRLGDTTVAHHLLPFLKETLPVRAEVAGAMARFGYQDSIPLIEKALPDAATVKAADAHHVYAMLQALHEMGSEKTPRLTGNYLEVPAMRHLHNLLEPFLGGRDMR